jgi:hypothetical protein
MLDRTQSPGVSTILLWVWIGITSLYFFGSIIYTAYTSQNLKQEDQINKQVQAAYANGYNAAVADALKSFSGNAFQNGQNNGYLTAFMNLGQALSAQVTDGCKQVIPINLGTGTTMGVVNVACLQQGQSGTTQEPAPAPAQ